MTRTLILIRRLTALIIILILTTSFASACSNTPSRPEDNVGVEVDGGEGEEVKHEHEDDHEHGAKDRLPNNGARIRIRSPLDGEDFAEGENVVVEVQVDDFELGADGRHWHIYVNGESWGMVTGGDTDQVVRDLKPGIFEISVFLTLRNHEELEDGDAVAITVSDAK